MTSHPWSNGRRLKIMQNCVKSFLDDPLVMMESVDKIFTKHLKIAPKSINLPILTSTGNRDRWNPNGVNSRLDSSYICYKDTILNILILKSVTIVEKCLVYKSQSMWKCVAIEECRWKKWFFYLIKSTNIFQSFNSAINGILGRRFDHLIQDLKTKTNQKLKLKKVYRLSLCFWIINLFYL